MASISDKLDGLIKELNENIVDNGGVPKPYKGGLTIAEHVDHIGKLIDSMPTSSSGSLASGSGFYSYKQTSTAKYIYIYYRSGSGYVRWELHNAPSVNENSNTWQIGPVYSCDSSFEPQTKLVTGGEFELALRENGAADFCGGNNHGDENTDTFNLWIDGKMISSFSELSEDILPFGRIQAVEEATINRCNTPSDDIIKHQKMWTFEQGKVLVDQTIKFLEQLSMDTVLVCMFPAMREIFPYGVRQSSIGVETMTSQGFDSPKTNGNEMFYRMYGPNVVADIRAKTNNPNDAASLWINSSSAELNKLYFTYFGSAVNSANPTTVSANTIIQAESEYKISYTAT